MGSENDGVLGDINIAIACIIFLVTLIGCARQLFYEKYSMINIHKIFHGMVMGFGLLRLAGALLYLFEAEQNSTLDAISYFVGRNAILAFNFCTILVCIFLFQEAIGVSRTYKTILWLVFWVSLCLSEMFVVVTTIIFAIHPSEIDDTPILFEISVGIGLVLSSLAVLGMGLAGIHVAKELFVRENRMQSVSLPEVVDDVHKQLYRSYFRSVFWELSIFTLITTILLSVRLVMLLSYVINLTVPLAVSLSLGYWVPELFLTCLFLFVMRGIPSEQMGFWDPNETRSTYRFDSSEDRLIKKRNYGGLSYERLSQEDPSSILFGTPHSDAQTYERLQDRLKQCFTVSDEPDWLETVSIGTPDQKRSPAQLFREEGGEVIEKKRKEQERKERERREREQSMEEQLHLSFKQLAPELQTPVESKPLFVGHVEFSVRMKTKEKIRPLVALFSDDPPSQGKNREMNNLWLSDGPNYPLRHAIYSCQKTGDSDVDAVQSLLDEEICVISRCDQNGVTPLHVSAMIGSPELIMLLLSKGGKKSTFMKTKKSFIPLHFFCEREWKEEEYEEVEKVLVELNGGKLINARTKLGETPLHRACQTKGDIIILQLLVKYGADIHAETAAGHTAKDLAKFNNLTAAISFFEKEEKEKEKKDREGDGKLLVGSKKGKEKVEKKEKKEKKESKANGQVSKCVEPIYVASYIEREDRDRTEAIFKQTNQASFLRTLSLKGVYGGTPLYLGLYHVMEDNDSLEFAKLIGTAEFSVDLLISQEAHENGLLIPLSTDGVQHSQNVLVLQLEHIESLRHARSGITRGYVFPCQQPDFFLQVKEDLQEGLYAFSLPALLLSLVGKEREVQSSIAWEVLERFSKFCAKTAQATDKEMGQGIISSAGIKDYKALKAESDTLEKLQLIFHEHRNHYKHLLRSIDNYSSPSKHANFYIQETETETETEPEETDLEGEETQEEERQTFKPSTKKAEEGLAFIPTNLHHQKMGVRKRGKRVGGGEAVGEYHVTTFGAPAAHTKKFKGGGVYSLEQLAKQKITEMMITEKKLMKGPKNEKSRLALFTSCVNALEAHFQFTRRRDICNCQVLPAVITSYYYSLKLHRNSPSILRQYAKIGYLCEFESLLSTHKNELGMLEDYEATVRLFVSNLRIRIVRSSEPNPTTSSLALEWKKKKKAEKPPSPLSLVSILSSSSGWEGLREKQLFGSFYDTHNLVVTIPVEGELYDKVVRGDGAGVGGKEGVRVVPILFTQGINEQQTLAIQLGNTSFQEKINKENVILLESYYKKFDEFWTKGCLAEGGGILKALRELESECLKSKKEKNVRILAMAADLVRLMNGGRLTSCKSAKDRTSMSVTWEQARLLSENHDLDENIFNAAISVMRSAGVRRENAYKNIGKNKFAFNSFQLKLIPDIYRAPKGSGGAQIT